MIKELSQEFGLPISQEDLTEGKLLAMSPPPAPSLEDFRSRNSTLTSEIQAHQEKYLQWRNTMILKNRDQKYSLIQKNISGAYEVSKKSPKSVVKVMKISAPAKDAVYNYSIQTLNSTELAKEELYREMAKEPRKRLTYSQSHLSATVEPQDSEEEKRKAERKSRDAWLTPSGFQVTGLHSTGRTHHLGLPPLGAITEEWREKALFANVLEPVLHRESWGWDRRHQDFDLYTQPPPFLELPPPPAPKPGTVEAPGSGAAGRVPGSGALLWSSPGSLPRPQFPGRTAEDTRLRTAPHSGGEGEPAAEGAAPSRGLRADCCPGTRGNAWPPQGNVCDGHAAGNRPEHEACQVSTPGRVCRGPCVPPEDAACLVKRQREAPAGSSTCCHAAAPSPDKDQSLTAPWPGHLPRCCWSPLRTQEDKGRWKPSPEGGSEGQLVRLALSKQVTD
eukprot:bmy_09943T0